MLYGLLRADRRVLVGIVHRESAAQVYLGQHAAGIRAQRGHKRGHLGAALVEGVQVEYLAAQVGMYAAQLQLRQREYAPERCGRLVRAHAELGIDARGLYVGMGMRVHARVHAQEHRLPLAALRAQPGQYLYLLRAVQHYAAHAHVQRRFQLRQGLVAAVQYDVLRREIGPARHVQLARAHAVQPHAALLHQHRHRSGEERLAGIGRRAARRVPGKRPGKARAAPAQVLLIIHVQRRAELARQLHAVAAAYHKMALRIDLQAFSQVHKYSPAFKCMNAAWRSLSPWPPAARRSGRGQAPLPPRIGAARAVSLHLLLRPAPPSGENAVSRPRPSVCASRRRQSFRRGAV